MDDTRTRKTLEQLADLYLTGNVPGAVKSAGDASGSQAAAPPVRLAPKLDFSRDASRTATTAPDAAPQGDAESEAEAEPNHVQAAAPTSPKPSTAGRDGRIHPPVIWPDAPPPPLRFPRAAAAMPDARDQASIDLDPDELDDLEPLEGPDPLAQSRRDAEAPTLRRRGSHQAIRQAGDITGRRRRSPDNDQPERHTAEVEAVFLGNLPGFSGPWLSQYAHELAKRCGPVAILRIDDEQVTVDLVGGSDHRDELAALQQRADGPAAHGLMPMLDRLTAPARALQGASDRLAEQPRIGAWVINVPMPLSDDAAELAMDFDQWTLLTGADESAVQAAAAWARQLAAIDQRPTDRRVRFMVMGSPAPRAQEAGEQLAALGAETLAGDVAFAGSRAQMQPIAELALGSFQAEDCWDELLVFLQAASRRPLRAGADDSPRRQALRDARHADDVGEVPASATGAEAQPADADADAEMLTDAQSDADSAADAFVAPAAKAPAPAAAPETQPAPETADPQMAAALFKAHATVKPLHDDPQPEDAASRPESTGQPAPPAQPQSQPQSHDESPDLVRLLGGLVALQARCPSHPDVQIALDEAGGMHLLARAVHRSGDDLAQHQAVLRGVVGRLLEVRNWTVQHRELLAMTQRQCRFDLHTQPTLHLFTDQARAAVPVAAAAPADLHITLLQPVHAAGQTIWYAADLS